MRDSPSGLRETEVRRGGESPSVDERGGLAGFLFGALAVGAVGAVGHHFPGGGGAQVAFADIGEGRGGGLGVRLGGAGAVEILMRAHVIASLLR